MLELYLIPLVFLSSSCFTSSVQSICNTGCDLALASYYLEQVGEILSVSHYINTNTSNILKYNLNTLPTLDSVPNFGRINLPFSCDCINSDFLGHVFNYNKSYIQGYMRKIAQVNYANLTTKDWIMRFNVYAPSRVPDTGNMNMTVNCSCGDRSISKDYGLFITYPLRPGETLESISSAANLRSNLIQCYNPGVNFSQGSGVVYIPW